jgi:hypothetical protein
MAERRCFSLLSAWNYEAPKEWASSLKKIIAMSSVNHRDVFGKSSRCLCQTIGKTFLYHREDFFYTCLKTKKNSL